MVVISQANSCTNRIDTTVDAYGMDHKIHHSVGAQLVVVDYDCDEDGDGDDDDDDDDYHTVVCVR